MENFKTDIAKFTRTALGNTFAITRAILQIVNTPALLTIVLGLVGAAFLIAAMLHMGNTIAAVSSLS